MQLLLQRSPQVLSRNLLDGILLLPRGTDQPIELNRTATDIWHRWTSPSRPDDIAAMLAEQYGPDPDIGRDVQALADLLVARGALEAVDDGPS